jgi:hypothetical protein
MSSDKSARSHHATTPIINKRNNYYSPDDTEDGEMASALLGGVGVLVVNVVVVEMEAAG